MLKSEGGWSDHPSDPGGATMKGITLRTFRAYFGEDRSKEDLKNISDDDIAYIYRKGYWDACKCNVLPTGVDYVVFDLAVNSGSRRASKFLQEAIESPADGIIGKNTIARIEFYEGEDIINDICLSRLKYMQRLSTWSTFGKGWSTRVLEVNQAALNMRYIHEKYKQV